MIAAAINTAALRYPRLYVKSRAQAYGVGDDHVFVVLTARDEAGTAEMDEAAAFVRESLETIGVTVTQAAG